MLRLFQITGSASFAARAALEEAGAGYEAVNVHPRRRDEQPDFEAVNPLRRVPALQDNDELIYETGAVLLYLVERLPGRGLGPLPGEPGRGALLRWVTWLADTLHGAYHPLDTPSRLTDDPARYEGIRLKGRQRLDAQGRVPRGASSPAEVVPREEFSVADIYLYMLKGWRATRTATR